MSICAVCDKQKQETALVQSTLTQLPFQVCKTCQENGFEPRYMILIAARSGKLAEAAEFIKLHKYVGAEIPAADII